MWRQWMVVVLLAGWMSCVFADTYADATAARKKGQLQQAMQLYQRAIEESDDHRAYNSIGTMYEFGEGVPQSYTKAFEYYKKAGDRGNVMAYGNTGALYDRGLGVKRNVPFAMELYFKGMNKGDSKSINNLGVMAGTGEILPQDMAVAWALFAFARDLGDPFAPDNLKGLQPLMTQAQSARARQVYQALKRAKPTARVDTFLDFMDLGD
ncbi:tetratricopeptide repeat protein [Neisseriaceae bacterium ESL0693]|nr:tetratricopeptide repeat protein [Neisseriaceae bacterium ESL0693]